MCPIEYAKNNKKKSIAIVGISIVFIALLSFLYNNKISPLSWGMWENVNTNNGLALDGYDAVAYHLQNSTQKGNKSYAYTYENATWHFSSKTNKQLFTQNPKKYMPKFGGYCAYGVGKGATAAVDVNAWLIEKGELFLFNDQGVKQSWLDEKKDGILNAAKINWKERVEI